MKNQNNAKNPAAINILYLFILSFFSAVVEWLTASLKQLPTQLPTKPQKLSPAQIDDAKDGERPTVAQVQIDEAVNQNHAIKKPQEMPAEINIRVAKNPKEAIKIKTSMVEVKKQPKKPTHNETNKKSLTFTIIEPQGDIEKPKVVKVPSNKKAEREKGPVHGFQRIARENLLIILSYLLKNDMLSLKATDYFLMQFIKSIKGYTKVGFQSDCPLKPINFFIDEAKKAPQLDLTRFQPNQLQAVKTFFSDEKCLPFKNSKKNPHWQFKQFLLNDEKKLDDNMVELAIRHARKNISYKIVFILKPDYVKLFSEKSTSQQVILPFQEFVDYSVCFYTPKQVMSFLRTYSEKIALLILPANLFSKEGHYSYSGHDAITTRYNTRHHSTLKVTGHTPGFMTIDKGFYVGTFYGPWLEIVDFNKNHHVGIDSAIIKSEKKLDANSLWKYLHDLKHSETNFTTTAQVTRPSLS